MAQAGVRGRPEHDRTSCSDERPINVDPEGSTGCARCTAIHLDQGAEPLWRTDAEIVEQTEILARYLLSWKWGLHPESPDAQLRNSQNTKARKAWNAACEIQDLLTATDVENAVAEVDDAARAAHSGSLPDLVDAAK